MTIVTIGKCYCQFASFEMNPFADHPSSRGKKYAYGGIAVGSIFDTVIVAVLL